MTDDINSKVSVKEIAELPVSSHKPDQEAKDEARNFEHVENIQRTNLGWIGRILGSQSEKPGNIAAVLLILLMVYLSFLTFKLDEGLHPDIVSSTFSVLTLILGYVFGSSRRE